MAGIDRRIPGGEQGDESRLRPLQVKSHLAVAIGRHFFEIEEPGFAEVETQFLVGLSAQQIVRAFDVGGGEQLAVMPFDALAQREGQLGPFLVRGPAGRQIRHDRLDPVLRHVLVEQHKIVEHPHHRHDRRDAALLDDGHAGGAVTVKHAQGAALLLRERRVGESHSQQHSADCRK